MTEVPEHLLQRSRDRRKALGLGDGDDGDGDGAPAASAAQTPATAAAAAPAAPSLPAFDIEPAKPPPEKPALPWVEAATRRKRIPYWVVPVLLFLPLWAFIYVGTLEEPAQGPTGILAEGAALYEANCAQCHGAGGAGTNAGPQLNDGQVLITFPDQPGFLGFAQHVEWVVKGTAGVGVGTPYGSPEQGRAAGWFGNMPAFGDRLTADEIVAVVLYERAEHGGSETVAFAAPIITEQLETGEVVLPEQWPPDASVEEIREILTSFAGAEVQGEQGTAGDVEG